MPRYALTITYDGAPFVGWQRQNNGVSVQGVIEAAFLSFCGETVLVYGSGRTDTGVHATGQVAHVDLQKEQPPSTILRAINFYLKDYPVRILAVDAVPDDFHARFSATARSYHYRLLNQPISSPFEIGRSWWIKKPLDLLAMQESARYLMGTHDFTSFRSTECQAARVIRTLDHISIEKKDTSILRIHLRSRSFLHNQVRITVGTLVQIGLGKWEPSYIKAILAARDRRQAGPTAPAEGLYFDGVFFFLTLRR